MRIITTIFGFLILLSSCTMESDNQKEFPNVFQVKNDSFQINNLRDTILIGRKGTKLKIYKNTFHSQNIKIILQEFYSKSDFLKAGLSTTSGNAILDSKGMIKIQAFDDEERIDKLLKEIEIQFSGSVSGQYQVFYGNTIDQYIDWQVDSLTKYYKIVENHILVGRPCIPFDNCDYAWDTVITDSIRWDKNYNQYDTILTFQESNDTLTWQEFWNNSDEARIIDKDYNYIFKTANLNWINCDMFLTYEKLTEVKIKTDYSGYPFAYAVFENQNSIVPGYLSNDGRIDFGKLPVGEIFTFVVIHKVDNQLFFDYHENIEITENIDLVIKLKETKKEDIKEIIENIDK